MSRLFILLSTLLLSACATENLYDDLSASPPSLLTKTLKPQTLGVAFGGGGVRGVMHLGVIKALIEEGITPDLVTGTSAGSIAAVMFASGMDYTDMENILLNVSSSDLADVVISSKGLINGQKLSDWVNQHVNQTELDSMPIPVGITATNLNTLEPIVIRKGNVGHAVQASSSIPGVFIPVISNESVLVDGGLVSVVPINSAREMGANIVIAVDIYCGNTPKPTQAMGGDEITFYSFRMMACKLSKNEIQSADVLIQPNFEPKTPDFFDYQAKLDSINAGYAATKKAIPKIKELIGGSTLIANTVP